MRTWPALVPALDNVALLHPRAAGLLVYARLASVADYIGNFVSPADERRAEGVEANRMTTFVEMWCAGYDVGAALDPLVGRRQPAALFYLDSYLAAGKRAGDQKARDGRELDCDLASTRVVVVALALVLRRARASQLLHRHDSRLHLRRRHAANMGLGDVMS